MIRSDVVGSLLRPWELKVARERRERGDLSAAAFKQIEDRAVDEAVRLQEGAGLDVVTDGELRRYAFFGHLIDALDGFDKLGGWAIPFHNEQGERLVF
ncbi:MAG TPA: methionine synthase, partial [Methylomirabilota bacterium]